MNTCDYGKDGTKRTVELPNNFNKMNICMHKLKIVTIFVFTTLMW